MKLILDEKEIKELLESLNEDSYLYNKITYQFNNQNRRTKTATQVRTLRAQQKVKEAIIHMVKNEIKLDVTKIMEHSGCNYHVVSKYKEKYIKEVLSNR